MGGVGAEAAVVAAPRSHHGAVEPTSYVLPFEPLGVRRDEAVGKRPVGRVVQTQVVPHFVGENVVVTKAKWGFGTGHDGSDGSARRPDAVSGSKGGHATDVQHRALVGQRIHEIRAVVRSHLRLDRGNFANGGAQIHAVERDAVPAVRLHGDRAESRRHAAPQEDDVGPRDGGGDVHPQLRGVGDRTGVDEGDVDDVELVRGGSSEHRRTDVRPRRFFRQAGQTVENERAAAERAVGQERADVQERRFSMEARRPGRPALRGRPGRGAFRDRAQRHHVPDQRVRPVALVPFLPTRGPVLDRDRIVQVRRRRAEDPVAAVENAAVHDLHHQLGVVEGEEVEQRGRVAHEGVPDLGRPVLLLFVVVVGPHLEPAVLKTGRTRAFEAAVVLRPRHNRERQQERHQQAGGLERAPRDGRRATSRRHGPRQRHSPLGRPRLRRRRDCVTPHPSDHHLL